MKETQIMACPGKGAGSVQGQTRWARWGAGRTPESGEFGEFGEFAVDLRNQSSERQLNPIDDS